VPQFKEWNFADINSLANTKRGIIADEEDFLNIIEDSFTVYYQALIKLVNRLRREVFPDKARWKRPNPELYRRMQDILYEFQAD
jgi:hypothetical protein